GDTDDWSRGIKVEQTDQRGTYGRRNLHNRSQWRNVAVLVAHGELVDVTEPQARLRIRLHVDLKHAPKLVELIDIARAEIAREGGKYLVERDSQCLGLHPVHVHGILRDIRAERGQYKGQRGLRLRIGNDGVGCALQLGD